MLCLRFGFFPIKLLAFIRVPYILSQSPMECLKNFAKGLYRQNLRAPALDIIRPDLWGQFQSCFCPRATDKKKSNGRNRILITVMFYLIQHNICCVALRFDFTPWHHLQPDSLQAVASRFISCTDMYIFYNLHTIFY